MAFSLEQGPASESHPVPLCPTATLANCLVSPELSVCWSGTGPRGHRVRIFHVSAGVRIGFGHIRIPASVAAVQRDSSRDRVDCSLSNKRMASMITMQFQIPAPRASPGWPYSRGTGYAPLADPGPRCAAFARHRAGTTGRGAGAQLPPAYAEYRPRLRHLGLCEGHARAAGNPASRTEIELGHRRSHDAPCRLHGKPSHPQADGGNLRLNEDGGRLAAHQLPGRGTNRAGRLLGGDGLQLSAHGQSATRGGDCGRAAQGILGPIGSPKPRLSSPRGGRSHPKPILPQPASETLVPVTFPNPDSQGAFPTILQFCQSLRGKPTSVASNLEFRFRHQYHHVPAIA